MQQITAPQTLRKAELNEILKGYPFRERRKEIIDVLMEFRKVSKKEAMDIKTIRPSEVQEVINRLK